MDGSLLSGENSADHLVLCNQECFLPQAFAANGYSTDSSSTQLTGGIGGSSQTYAHSSYPLMTGTTGQQNYRPDLPPMDSETLAYFDESSGLYPQGAPFLDSPLPDAGAFLPPLRPSGFDYNVYSETTTTTNGSSSGGGGNALAKDSPLFVPGVCQDPVMDLTTPWTNQMTSSQLDAEANKRTLTDFHQSMLGLPPQRLTSSSMLPFQELPMTMEPLTQTGNTGVLEPSLTSPINWWNAAMNASIKEEDLSKKDGQVQSSPESVCNGSKTRWKPNTNQLCFLEQHFRTGFTKATPELFSAVKEVGPATESQVSVWLKNRLARCKRYSNREMEAPRSDESSNVDAEYICSTVSGNKRERQEDDLSEDFATVRSTVLDELSGILQSVDGQDVKGLARAIRDANNICCYGVSREGLAMKGLALNLFHLGFKARFVGDTTTPPLTKGDLFLVAAGPSYYSTVSALGLEAMRAGARVIAFTAHKTAPLPFAESVIRVSSQTLPPCMPVMNRKLGGVASEVVSSLPEGRFSCMQMGGSFEVALTLVLDTVCVMLRKKLQVSTRDRALRRANLT